jgi:GTP cyclohydrolase I
MNQRMIEDGVKRILIGIGEDVNREGLRDTPKRVAKAYKELLAGYEQRPNAILKRRFTVEKYDQMIILRNIDFFSLCEHHLQTFFGTVSVGYIPKMKVLGLSKIARIVEMYARRLQIQERMTEQIANVIQKELDPRGVAVIVKATHFCMVARGIKKHEPEMITSALLGEFRNNPTTRAEFMSLTIPK